MQMPMITLRFRPLLRSNRVRLINPKTDNVDSTAEIDNRADRERQTERYMRSVGIWENFLHLGGGPTIRR